ncbi:pentatricopeptide repeat-containing family protein, partial [Striga asiatica]
YTHKQDVAKANHTITRLCKEGKIQEAREMFEQMPERDVISWTALISGHVKCGMLEEARAFFDRADAVKNVIEDAYELFRQMPERNVVSWTIMVSGLAGDGKPNEVTFASVLCACGNLAGLNEGAQVHQVISKTIYHQESNFVVSALINMYSKCGDLEMARRAFDDGLIGHQDLVSWNSMIAAYAQHGHGFKAISVFEEMRKTGFEPNDVTYVGLLNACTHAGLVQEGLNYFNALLEDGSARVRDDHYTCVVDLYGRAGRLKEAYDLITGLSSLKDSAYAWGALLLGCNVHGEREIGRLAAERLLELEPENENSYVLLSNVYRVCGDWKEAEGVKSRMKGGGLKKQPGCSWIEVRNEFRVFVVGDRSSLHGDIHLLLWGLHEKMRKVEDLVLENVLMEENFL